MSDALASLQKAIAPPHGMQRISLPLETYEHPSLPLSAKKLCNLMAEAAPADARAKAALIPTPGMSLSVTAGLGPIWAINNEWGGWYVVSGRGCIALAGQRATPGPSPI